MVRPLPDFGDLYRTPVAVCSALSTTDIWPAAKSILRHLDFAVVYFCIC